MRYLLYKWRFRIFYLIAFTGTSAYMIAYLGMSGGEMATMYAFIIVLMFVAYLEGRSDDDNYYS